VGVAALGCSPIIRRPVGAPHDCLGCDHRDPWPGAEATGTRCLTVSGPRVQDPGNSRVGSFQVLSP
jgi:hypothetical protein